MQFCPENTVCVAANTMPIIDAVQQYLEQIAIRFVFPIIAHVHGISSIDTVARRRCFQIKTNVLNEQAGVPVSILIC